MIGANEDFESANWNHCTAANFPGREHLSSEVVLNCPRRYAEHPRCLTHVNGQPFKSVMRLHECSVRQDSAEIELTCRKR